MCVNKAEGKIFELLIHLLMYYLYYFDSNFYLFLNNFLILQLL